jgi:hypothetical protein
MGDLERAPSGRNSGPRAYLPDPRDTAAGAISSFLPARIRIHTLPRGRFRLETFFKLHRYCRQKTCFINHIPAGPEIGQWLNPVKYKEKHFRPVASSRTSRLPARREGDARQVRKRQDFLCMPVGSGPSLARFLSDTA